MSANKTQVGGNHYRKHKIQPWDVIDEYQLDFYGGNVLKYLLRHNDKGKPLEDLQKAQHYLQKLIEQVEQQHRVSGVPYSVGGLTELAKKKLGS